MARRSGRAQVAVTIVMATTLALLASACGANPRSGASAATTSAAATTTVDTAPLTTDPAAATATSTTTIAAPAAAPSTTTAPNVATTGAAKPVTTTATRLPITTTTTKAPPPPTAAPTTTIARPASFPITVNVGNATQVITVASHGTTATVQAWQRSAAGAWAPVPGLGPVGAFVGRNGVSGNKHEGDGHTPAGTFGISQAFGLQSNPGTALPYRGVDAASYWVSDPASAAYNTWQECSGGCSFNTALGEHLIAYTSAYQHAVVIDYNRFPVVAGAGSAIFLHVSTGGPTAGCVSVPSASLSAIMRWLDPAQHPRIAIG